MIHWQFIHCFNQEHAVFTNRLVGMSKGALGKVPNLAPFP
jgi:hypothetical protein